MRSGPFGGDHFMQRAPPAEAHRRAVGHQREHILDRLGPGQQPQGPRARACPGAVAAERIPAGVGFAEPAPARCRRRARGYGCRGQSDARPAAARAARSGGRSGGRARPDLRASPRPICSVRQGSAASTESRARSKPKPGSSSSPSAASRSTNSARIACGSRTGREVPAAMRLTTPSVRKSASSRRRAPSPRAASIVASRACEPLDGRQHILLACDRLVKIALRDIGRDRQERGERLVFAA